MQGQKTSNNKSIKEWYAEHQYMMIEVLMVTTTAKQSQLPSYIFQLASALQAVYALSRQIRSVEEKKKTKTTIIHLMHFATSHIRMPSLAFYAWFKRNTSGTPEIPESKNSILVSFLVF